MAKKFNKISSKIIKFNFKGGPTQHHRLTGELALAQEFQMRPEEVVRIIRHELIEVIQGHVVEVTADKIKIVYVQTVEVEVIRRPMEPEAHVCLVPHHRI